MTSLRTPGMMYFVRPCTLSGPNQFCGTWYVISISRSQGEAMRRRGVRHVYDSSAQAHAVAKKLRRRPR